MNISSRSKRTAAWLMSVSVLLLAVCSVMRYLWSDLLVMEFQTDVADTLLWAEAIVNSGKLVSPDHYYPYIIPFGGQLLMLPFIPAFGVTLTTLRLGMTLFFVLFALALTVFFHRAIFRSLPAALMSAGTVLMLFEYNKKLREVMYAHVIHYSLAILCTLLLLIAVALLLERGKKTAVWHYALLSAACFLSSANGTTILALALCPVGMAFVLERLFATRFFTRKWETCKQDLLICAVVSASMIAGLAAYTLLSHGASYAYETMYTELNPVYLWVRSLAKTLYQWIVSTFRPELYADITPILSDLSPFGRLMHLVTKLAMAGVPFLLIVLSFVRYRHLKTRTQRIILLTFWTVSAVTLVLHTILPLSSYSWRVIPMLFSLFVAYLLLFGNMLTCENGLMKKLAALMLAVLLVTGINGGVGVLAADPDEDIWTAEGSVIHTLRENGLTDGYSNAHILCETVALITDNEIHMPFIDITEDTHEYRATLYQNDPADFFPHEDPDKHYFVLIVEPDNYPEPDGYTAKYEGTTYFPDYDQRHSRYTPYTIYVFDRYPLTDTLSVRFSDTVYQLSDLMAQKEE